MTKTWQTVVAESDFPIEGILVQEIAGWQLLVAKSEDSYYAINDRCPHQGAKLSGGRVRRGAVMCPLHGARFDLASGHCIGGSYGDLRLFDLRIVEGKIEVYVPNEKPNFSELPSNF